MEYLTPFFRLIFVGNKIKIHIKVRQILCCAERQEQNVQNNCDLDMKRAEICEYYAFGESYAHFLALNCG